MGEFLKKRAKSFRVDQRPKNKLTRQKSHVKRRIGVFLGSLGVLGVIGLVGAKKVQTTYLKGMPQITSESLSSKAQAKNEVYSADGTLLFTTQHIARQNASIKEVKQAKNLQNALISIEDRDFYDESGTSYKRILSAALQDLRYHQAISGASTITQQLVKGSVFSSAAKDRTIKRKLQEIYLAEWVNQHYSKDQILTYYVNKVYMGNGVYGMKTAAKYYFNKNLQDLTVDQAAMLAGLVQSPSGYDPYGQQKSAVWRRNMVLNAMHDNKKLSAKELKQHKKTPLTNGLVAKSSHDNNLASYDNKRLIADSYLQGTWNQLAEMGIDVKNPGHVDHKIVIPMQMKLQTQLKSMLDNDSLYPDQDFQVAVSVIDNKSGQMIAQYGGRHQNQISGYDRAISMRRSSGSSIKPLLDYGPVFDQKQWDMNTIINDNPYSYRTGGSVHDWDNKYQGPITTTKALAGSRNIPAIKAFNAVGIPIASQYLDNLGLKDKLTESSAIGVNVSPLQMASAYTALANGGTRLKPQFVKQVQGGENSGTVQTATQNVYEPQTAFMLTQMMKKVPTNEGTAPTARVQGAPAAGKTGTVGYDASYHKPNDALTDAWYVGYTKGVTVAVWTGYDNLARTDGKYLHQSQEEISQRIFKQVMQQYINSKQYDNSDWKAPAGLIRNNGNYQWNSKRIGNGG